MSAKRICVGGDQQTSDDGNKDQKKVVNNSLDYDSLAKIIMLLPIAERIEMEKVCTKWKEACQLAWYDIKKYKCELSIGRSYDNRLLTQQYLEKILLMCGIYLNELSLSDVCKASIMPFVGDHCKNLTSLELPSIPGGPLSFPSVLDELSKLQYLEHLNLRAAKNLEDSTIIAIGNNCKYLKSLDIQDCIAITETALVTLTNLENLQKLNVRSLNITDDFIIKLKGLKELHCNGCKKLTNAGIIQLIKNNPDLEEISVRDTDKLEEDSSDERCAESLKNFLFRFR
ncbi:protein ARABIDILLO 1-like [Aphidius gifuensis]|uniref:protein ARABIDILLO 1-like n=1 Tax=Aphidius gifuensis TaxID=684658 RepID=UPI001CDB5F7D|nr:protein ARABIDILLO 1-like [Aphidius gifuensis]